MGGICLRLFADRNWIWCSIGGCRERRLMYDRPSGEHTSISAASVTGTQIGGRKVRLGFATRSLLSQKSHWGCNQVYPFNFLLFFFKIYLLRSNNIRYSIDLIFNKIILINNFYNMDELDLQINSKVRLKIDKNGRQSF